MGQIPGRCCSCRPSTRSTRLDLAADTPVAYITQTTLSVDDTRAVIAALKRRFTDIVGPDIDDICYATQNRQSAVRELAKVADVILVVGAKNSSNSNRLREIGVECGVPSYLIADGSELDAAWVRGRRRRRHHRRRFGTRGRWSTALSTALRALGAIEVSVLPGIEEKVEFRLPAELVRARADSLAQPPDAATAIHRWRSRYCRRRASAPTSCASSLRGGARYPLVLMLEPLFRCNLACAGCGKIDYPDGDSQPPPVASPSASQAVDECGAPVVSIAGGEPLLHKEIDSDRRGHHRAAQVRLPVHERAAAAEAHRIVQAQPVFRLVGAPRRRPRDARPLRVRDRRLRARGRGDPRGQGARLSRQHQLHAVQRRRARSASHGSSTTSARSASTASPCRPATRTSARPTRRIS